MLCTSLFGLASMQRRVAGAWMIRQSGAKTSGPGGPGKLARNFNKKSSLKNFAGESSLVQN